MTLLALGFILIIGGLICVLAVDRTIGLVATLAGIALVVWDVLSSNGKV